MSDTSIISIIDLQPIFNGDIPLSELSTITASNNNPDIADTSVLIIEGAEPINIEQFLTLEHNINILDGSLNEYNSNINKYGYWSTNLSDNECKTNNTVNITFDTTDITEPINIYGILINFINDVYISANELVYTYQSNTTSSKFFSPGSNISREFFEGNKITGIKINFKYTKFPRMFSRMYNISYDISYDFDKHDIISCNLNEEFSPISQIISPTVCELTIYSMADNLDLTSSEGIKIIADRNIRCDIYSNYYSTEQINSLIHSFYVSEIYGNNSDSITIKLISLLGKLDNYSISPDALISGKEADILLYILNDLELIYSFSWDLFNTARKDIYLNTGTVRDILREFLFSINAIVTDRNFYLNISRPSYEIKYSIDNTMLLDYPKLTKINELNNISVTTYNYIQSPDSSLSDLVYTPIYTGKINSDGIELIFEKPAWWYRYSIQNSNGEYISNDKTQFVFDGAIQLQDNKFCANDMGFGGTLKYRFVPHSTSDIDINNVTFNIEINYYIENKIIHSSGGTTSTKLLNIDNMKIFNENNVSDFINNIYNYYQSNSYKIEFTYLWDSKIRVGDTVYIYTDYEHYLRATIVKQSIDLGNGFISRAVAVGDIINPAESNYMSDGNDGQYDIIMEDNIQI